MQSVETVRVWFEKTGPAKYISHLDLTHCMARGLKLSRLPVWYTEGFNPRIYMTYGMPLSLGIAGLRECMDIRLTEPVPLEAVKEKLGQRLPGGIRILEVTQPREKLEHIGYGLYEIRLEEDRPGLGEAVERLLSREEIIVKKHTKKGERDLDIKPYFQEAKLAPCQNGVLLKVLLPCSQEGSVNPGLLLEALKAYEGREPFSQITRVKLLTKEFSEMG